MCDLDAKKNILHLQSFNFMLCGVAKYLIILFRELQNNQK